MKIADDCGYSKCIQGNDNLVLNSIVTDSDGNPTDLVYKTWNNSSLQIGIFEAKSLIETLTRDVNRVEKQFDKFLNPVTNKDNKEKLDKWETDARELYRQEAKFHRGI